MPPEPPSITSDKRRLLALLCRTRERRVLARSLGSPNNWRPFSVDHPDHGSVFNDEMAWDFIADMLESDTPVRWSGSGPGRPFPAIEIIVPVSNADRRLYMKIGIMIAAKKVLGLSFHYSTEEYK